MKKDIPDLTITVVDNGYILRTMDDVLLIEIVERIYDTGLEATIRGEKLCHAVLNLMGIHYSKHDDWRLNIERERQHPEPEAY